MAFNRFDDRRSTYNFEKTPSRGRTFFRNGDSPLLFRRKPFLNGNASVPSSVASSRDSSLDRNPEAPPPAASTSFHQVVGRVMSSPRMSLRKKFQVMRSGSFSDAKSTLDNKRKKWLLERSGSLRLPGKYKKDVVPSVMVTTESPWSSPEADRRGSLPMSPSPLRDRSLDRVQLLERRGSYNPNDLESGRIKGFVNRYRFLKKILHSPVC